jgi:ABC-type uncharacterized transport system substrate-binding protein
VRGAIRDGLRDQGYIIVALLTLAAQAARNATSTTPIVMAPAGDPIASGLSRAWP